MRENEQVTRDLAVSQLHCSVSEVRISGIDEVSPIGSVASLGSEQGVFHDGLRDLKEDETAADGLRHHVRCLEGRHKAVVHDLRLGEQRRQGV